MRRLTDREPGLHAFPACFMRGGRELVCGAMAGRGMQVRAVALANGHIRARALPAGACLPDAFGPADGP